MPSFISAAVDEAARLPDIHFPEFTAKLITDTFDALVAANLKQTETYAELLKAVSKSLTDYINDTKDDISGAEILEFLALLLPPPNPNPKNLPTKVAENEKLTQDEAKKLSEALTLPDGTKPQIPHGTELSANDVERIKDSVARRLAANKYDLLKQMVKMGVLRLVVEKGVIETRLTFTTTASSFYQRNSYSYNTKDFAVNAAAKTGFFLSKWVSASASTKYTSVTVRTTNETQRDISGSTVNIFGRVEIHFKTDYQPLSE
jgi:hypothetical protein